MDQFRSFLQRLRESLFFVPVLGIVVFAALALLTLYIDRRFASDLTEAPLLLASTVAGGRSVATTVAGATITVAAIVFSITALSSQIAANQYSPRSVRGFFEDPLQQLVIALIVGTFTFSVIVLGGLSTATTGAATPTPSLAVTVTVILGVASAIGIVAYLDHSLQRFQVDAVVRRIANDTLKAVRRAWQSNNDNHRSRETGTEQPTRESAGVVSHESGWVQRLGAARLVQATAPGTLVKIEVRLGEAVSEGDRIASVWTQEAEMDATAHIIRSHITVERRRSIDNDAGFGIRQLVDIALKALSPGINDPTTAVDVIHHLKPPIRAILQADPPVRVFSGPDGQRAYLSATPSRSDFVHLAFSEIRLAANGQTTVLAALLEVVGDLRSDLETTGLGGRIGALDEEWDLTIGQLRNSGLPEPDVERVLRDRTSVSDEKVDS